MYILSSYTVGTPYYMYVSKDDIGNSYCLLIDEVIKKGYSFPKMILIRNRFSDEVCKGSLFHGELVKSQQSWGFILNDVVVTYGNSLVRKPLYQRVQVLQTILQNEWKNDPILQTCPLYCKKFFSNHEGKKLVDEFIPTLPYPCKGVLFHCVHSNYQNRCYLFKQRPKYKITHPKKLVLNQSINYIHKPKKIKKTEYLSVKNNTHDIPRNTTHKTKTTSKSFIQHIRKNGYNSKNNV